MTGYPPARTLRRVLGIGLIGARSHRRLLGESWCGADQRPYTKLTAVVTLPIEAILG